MSFRHAIETEIVESIIEPNIEIEINYISRKILIMCKNRVLYYLKELFNFCIDSLIFSNVLEIAWIPPIHKKCLIRIISHYRPVSVIINLSKTLENLLYNCLQSNRQASDILAKKISLDFHKHCNMQLYAKNQTCFRFALNCSSVIPNFVWENQAYHSSNKKKSFKSERVLLTLTHQFLSKNFTCV